jgi:hypothetical protein
VKWILVFLSLSVNDDVCNGPLTVMKYSDEIYDTKEECQTAFREARFYKTRIKQQIVGVCLQGEPMYMSPEQLENRPDYPDCHK